MDTYTAKAKRLAKFAHLGLVDEAGVDYFTGHLTKVAALVDGDDAKTVAFLHDILEDTDTRTADLYAAGFLPLHVMAVTLLTRPAGVTYFDYIKAIISHADSKAGALALIVKKADTADHLADTTHITASLLKRYLKAKSLLDSV